MAISIFRGIGSAIGVPAQALPKPKSASKFRDIAYCGTFRSDGKLLAAGDATGKVTVFEAATATLLRELAGHKDATRVVAWAADNMHLLSGSDDCSLRYWDLPTQKSLLVQKGAHADFVRAAAQSPASDETWLTGGYDRKVRLWDVRVPRTGDDGGERRCNALMEMDHGSPVEATLFLPGGGIALSAGGDVIKVWDVLAGGRELHSLSHHSRAITSLVLDGTRTRLISGGLDGHVRRRARARARGLSRGGRARFDGTPRGARATAGQDVLALDLRADAQHQVRGAGDRARGERREQPARRRDGEPDALGAPARRHEAREAAPTRRRSAPPKARARAASGRHVSFLRARQARRARRGRPRRRAPAEAATSAL